MVTGPENERARRARLATSNRRRSEGFIKDWEARQDELVAAWTGDTPAPRALPPVGAALTPAEALGDATWEPPQGVPSSVVRPVVIRARW